MADDADFDPCECIFTHEAGIRRLISLLRNSQSYCTDNECLQELPGLNSSQSDMSGFVFMLMIWAVLAGLLFLMRPSSLRRRNDGKPSNQGPGNSGAPPPAPIH
uniref:Small integral membrane protein 14 n=1 Tax=Strigamia maritima TaxID=126957 RepID=T1JNV3_STRMM